jgi:hypothetical protein
MRELVGALRDTAHLPQAVQVIELTAYDHATVVFCLRLIWLTKGELARYV